MRALLLRKTQLRYANENANAAKTERIHPSPCVFLVGCDANTEHWRWLVRIGFPHSVHHSSEQVLRCYSSSSSSAAASNIRSIAVIFATYITAQWMDVVSEIMARDCLRWGCTTLLFGTMSSPAHVHSMHIRNVVECIGYRRLSEWNASCIFVNSQAQFLVCVVGAQWLSIVATMLRPRCRNYKLYQQLNHREQQLRTAWTPTASNPMHSFRMRFNIPNWTCNAWTCYYRPFSWS